ncbi:MAG: hypothetical protein OEV46_03320 [Betaproteobacteria bacterium]|nr:hypothetical protein [Betaproteobacteria bacterium]MDH5285307.1 hypothetical protein [Betaproteobacteria bacterium]
MTALLAAAVPPAQAQPAPLPGALSGRWTVVPAGGRALVDVFSVRFDGTGAPGPVTGKLTWRGVNCGAQDEPLKGTWDGVELRFESHLRANSNTQNMNGACGNSRGEWVLRRKPGSSTFEGEGLFNEGKVVATLTAAP